MRLWKRFLAFPDSTKHKLSRGDRQSDFGYNFRSGSGAHRDVKSVLHYNRSTEPALLRMAATIPDPTAIQLIYTAKFLLNNLQPYIEMYAQAIEEAYDVLGFSNEMRANSDKWVIRFLYYLPGALTLVRPHNVIAHPHTDRGSITSHLLETTSGGELYTFGRFWRPWPVTETETIFFSGVSMQRRSQGRIRAICHRVVVPPAVYRAGRHAMVLFADARSSVHFDPRYSQQHFPPGKFYGTDAWELEQYYVSRPPG
jgi:hypothetical protein